MRRLHTWSMSVIAVCLMIIATGCRSEPAPAPPGENPTPTLTTDEKVLLILDCYEPIYKVDANGRVIHLRLTGHHLPAAVMAEIGKLTELQGLDCYGSTLDDEGLAQLGNLQKLRNFGMGATAITDKGLVHLEKLQALQFVWVPAKTVSQDGRDRLKEARPDMNIYPQ